MAWLCLGAHIVVALACLGVLAAFVLRLRRSRDPLPVWGLALCSAFLLASGASPALAVLGFRAPPTAAECGCNLVAAALSLPAAAVLRCLIVRARRRVRRATATAGASAALGEGTRWNGLAEEVAQVGHWRLSLPDLSVAWSDGIYRIHGRSRKSGPLTLQSALAAYLPEDRPIMSRAIEQAVATRGRYEVSVRLMRPDGEVRHVLSRGMVSGGQDGQPPSLFGVLLDVTELKQTESRLLQAQREAEESSRALAAVGRRDSAAGLAGRAQFDASLDVAFGHARRAGAALAIIVVEVVRFTQYVERHGGKAGEACLRAVAGAVTGALHRPHDLVARYGRADLAVLLPGADAAGAAIVARRITVAVRAMALEYRGSPGGLVTVSLGAAAFAPVRADMVALDLIERAERALYAARDATTDPVRRSVPSRATAQFGIAY